MDALISRAVTIAAAALSLGAGYRTQNFIVTARSPQLAREIGDGAEQYRKDLAIEWLGRELPPWNEPCPVVVDEGPNLGAGGATSFIFEGRRPFGWRMAIQGSRQRLLDSVLPHEVTHTIFATHFGRPLPRWADEGACTTVEHPSERSKQQHFLIQFLRSSPPRSIPFNKMFRMKEYPRDIMPLYAQGHSVARYLIQQGGKRKFIEYVGLGMDTNNWDRATRQFYGQSDLSELQLAWVDWVAQGSPRIDAQPLDNPQVADTSPVAGGSPGATEIAMAGVGGAGRQPERMAVRETPRETRPPQGSWYARQRTPSRGTVRESSGSNSVAWQPGSSRGDLSQVPRAMARPQGTQQPHQMVLEWAERPQAPVGPGVQLRRSGVSGEPVIYHDAAPGTTMMR